MIKTTGDYTLDWMLRNLPPEQVTLRSYVALNWCACKQLEDLDAEELAQLPEELFPEPASKLIQ